MNRKIRMGMVGGGQGAFIGGVHRTAASMDGRIELVSGCFSSSSALSIESGRALGLADDRVYGNYRDMMRKEGKLTEAEGRLDFVAIVTHNNMHYPIAMAALENGFHVLCDKPMTISVDEAINLEKKVQQQNRLFCLTHNYTGYPMVKEARELVNRGRLGEIRRVVVEYPQGWLATRMETQGQKQAMWRTDPRKAGPAGCVGDIGSHCANLAAYITGLELESVCSDLTTFVPGRPLDDDASILLRFNNGARGLIWSTQIGIGEENDLNIRVYGEKGSLEWHQHEPNTLIHHRLGKPTEIHRTATESVGKLAAANTRLPAGHVEGFYEAFANIYRNFADDLAETIDGKPVKTQGDYPNVKDGIDGIRFIEAVVKSSKSKEKWIKV